MLSYRLRHQQGATLIVLVLLTMLLLLAVLLVTTNLTMSARTTTTDQRQLVPAQLAAESGIAAATTFLKASEVLTSINQGIPVEERENYTIIDAPNGGKKLKNGDYKSPLQQQLGLDMSFNETMALLGKVCGTSGAANIGTAAPSLGNWAYEGQVQMTNVAVVCSYPENSSLDNQQLDFFRSFMTFNNAGVASSFAKYGLDRTDAEKEKYLRQVFNNAITNAVGDGTASYELRGGFEPIALLRGQPTADAATAQTLADYPYYLVFKVGDIESTGSYASSRRRMVMSNQSQLYALRINFSFFGGRDYTEEQTINSFTNFGFFIDDAAGARLTSADRILGGGRMHTNTFWRATGVDGGHLVDAKMTSAGCESIGLGTADPVTGERVRTCTNPGSRAGMQFGNTFFGATSLGDMGPSGNAGYNRYGGAGGQFTYNTKYPIAAKDFSSDYVPLPTNAIKQRELAQSAGVAVSGNNGNIDRLRLYVSNTNGTKFQCMDILQQSITYSLCYDQPDSSGKSAVYVYDSSKRAYVPASKNAASPISWSPSTSLVRTEFNGVIHATGRISSLTGPTRNEGAGPAIADFGNITVAVEGTGTTNTLPAVTITGDLKLEDRAGKGVMGIYAVRGDLAVANNGSNRTQQTDPRLSTALNAPDNIQLDSFMMTSSGRFYVQRLSVGPRRGLINSYGGYITSGFGATENPSLTSGYGLSSTHDGREIPPRGFPTYSGPAVVSSSQVQFNGVPRLVSLEVGYVSMSLSGATPDFSAGEVRQVGIE